ncbi:MAG: Sua5/YciO/YrdC/YwlC family protein, partial [Gammaproteobacteria bacterium]|nr:Sua5/YciO/YrdC/YwlC family protein [Gammaproteobacteria bacterium]
YIEPVSAEINAKLQSTWPGPVTWLLPAKQQTPNWLTGTHTTLACRVSDHPLVKQLCSAFNGALVSTSANIASQKPCKSAIQVRKQFKQQRQLMIIPGHLGDLKQPTRIFNALNDTQIR